MKNLPSISLIAATVLLPGSQTGSGESHKGYTRTGPDEILLDTVEYGKLKVHRLQVKVILGRYTGPVGIYRARTSGQPGEEK